MSFADLNMPPGLIAALARQQITDPTPIQIAALPVLPELERGLHERPDLLGEEAGVLVEPFQLLAVAYALLAVLGVLPATQTTFGLIPIYGNDVWLHALIALAAGVIGFTNVFAAPVAARR